MQIFVLLLAIAVVAPYESGGWPPARLEGPALLATVFAPYVLLIALELLLNRWAQRSLYRTPGRAERTLRRLHAGQTVTRWAALVATYAAVFAVGWGDWLAGRVGAVPLGVELAVIAPALAVPIAGWWAQHPIERRLHDAAMMRRIDDGLPIAPMPTRRVYVWGQVRHQVLLMLVPVLAVLLWVQVVRRYIQPGAYEGVWAIAGGATVFALAPLIIRHIWDTEPMPAGSVRDMLLRVCRANRVKVRELLLWRTHTGMVNGAVMGLVPRLRYVLLTDGLLEQMPPEQVEAVMAHELGHVRRRHMPWMIVWAFGAMGLAVGLMDLAATGIDALGGSAWLAELQASSAADAVMGGVMLIAAGAWALAFGYVSRRLERQADTFAVQHMSRTYPDADRPGTVTGEAVDAMAGALLNVAGLNHAPTDRRSWRHGAIDWRVGYLRSLVGQPTDRLAIDRQVRWLCLVGLVMLAVSMTMTYWFGVPGV